jgi:hypothetical protein
MALLPKPTKISYTVEQLRERFIRVAVDMAPDPTWHYRIGLPIATKMRPHVGRVAPTPQAPIQSLGLFYREDAELDLEVIGVLLGREIDPAHWLEMYLDFNRLSVETMQQLPLSAGIVGDAVCEWTANGRPYAGRFVALKFGARMYVVCCRASRETYARCAEDFFVSLAQFGPIDDTRGLCAEPVANVSGPAPVPWRVYVPQSWSVTPEESSGFQASLSAPSPSGAPVDSCWTAFPGAPALPAPEGPPAETYMGKMAMTLAPLAVMPTSEAARAAALETFRDAGLEFELEEFGDEDPQGPLEESALLVAPARLGGNPGVELRCRVGRTHGVWFVAGVVGPARSTNPFAWMQNKRTLDVVTGSLHFGD